LKGFLKFIARLIENEKLISKNDFMFLSKFIFVFGKLKPIFIFHQYFKGQYFYEIEQLEFSTFFLMKLVIFTNLMSFF